MSYPNPNSPDSTVFLLTHTGNDARNAAAVLGKVAIPARICASMRALCDHAAGRAGALIIGEEAVEEKTIACLAGFLVRQPAWSDIPLILLTASGDIQQKTSQILDFLGARANVTLLEKPLRAITLISVVKTALRSRNRQYEIRNLLENYAASVRDEQTASAKFRAVFEQSSVFAGIMTIGGKITEANRLCLDVCGYRADQVVGRLFWEGPWWRGSKAVQEKIRAGTMRAAQGATYTEVLPYLWADGTERTVEFALYPIRDETGNILFLHPTGVDITERERSEKALRVANALLADKAGHLESLVQQRTVKLQEMIGELEAFSYSIAHDMRAPLRSLQGYAEILLETYDGKLDANGRHFLQRIAKSANRMDKLIRDVLNYSRVVRADLTLENVDVEQLLREIIDTYPMLAPDKAEIVLKPPFPRILGNEAMLTQIFSNLMGNGVKFVPLGVKPKLVLWAETGAERVRLFVKDNGIGIAPDHHEEIFGIFQQVDKAIEGTGIGLAIVKKAVERMGGKVGVQSELNKGSTFWVELKPA